MSRISPSILSSKTSLSDVRLNYFQFKSRSRLFDEARIGSFHVHFGEVSSQLPFLSASRSILSLEKRNAFQLLNSRRGFSTFNDKIKMTVEDNNHYKLSLPLPGSGNCIFFLKGEQTVKNFVEDLQTEDNSVENASVLIGSSKVSSSTQLDRVFRSPFTIQINQKTYEVTPAIVTPTIPISLPVHEDEHEHPQLDRLKKEFIPLLAQKLKLDSKAASHSNLLMYGGLGFLVAQWCFLARLTWWEFNWDIMEPVTYFITFGTAVLGYAYFAIQKRDYSFVDLRESILVKRMFKEYTKANFDVDKYFALEYKLNQLDPVALNALKHLVMEAEYHQPQQTIESAKREAENAKADFIKAEPEGVKKTPEGPKAQLQDIVEGKH